MINTVDFITPPVNDPYWFGQISAANSISDVYSMGGRPLTALNLVMFPAEHLDMGILKEILRGGHDKVQEAGASLVGGHSVDDNEPKYGLCVNGIVHPDRILTNAGAKAGDALILTKPLGSGVLFNAVRGGKFGYEDLERDSLPIIAMLNKTAVECALDYSITSCTDVTGFGILGHSLEMALGSKTHIIIDYNQLNWYPGSLEMYKKKETTGSNKANRALVTQHSFRLERDLAWYEEEILFDPQTSGGLLLSLPKEQAPDLLEKLYKNDLGYAAIVGEVVDGEAGLTVV